MSNITNIFKLCVRYFNNRPNTLLELAKTIKLNHINNVRNIYAIGYIAEPTVVTRNWIYDTSIRNYAKGKDKKKDKGKGKVQINESQISEIVNVDNLKSQMQKSIEILKDDFTKHLSLRSSAGSIESIVVNVDGADHTMQEIAQIVRKNPKLVVINMAVFPQAIPAALHAIAKSGMNLNPQQEGTTIYIPVPKVTKEHREGLAKNAKQLFVKCKDSIRDVQTKQSKSLKKKTGVSEDLLRSVEQQIIAIADAYINEAQKIMEKKQEELIGKD